MSKVSLIILALTMVVLWAIPVTAQPPGGIPGLADQTRGKAASGINWGQTNYGPSGIPTSCPPGMVYRGLGRGCVRAMCPRGKVFDHKRRRCVAVKRKPE